MEIIQLHHPYDPALIPPDEVVLVLGFFDGVHRGHQAVLQKGKEIAQAKGLKLAAMTFDHHPSIVFKKPHTEMMKYLTTLEQKAEIMESLGVDLFYVTSFTSSFAHLDPQAFVDQYIVALHAEVVVAGFDYTYGPQETANMDLLPQYAKNRFEIVAVKKVTEEEKKISSTRIRELLDQSRIEEANELLGYSYETRGVVVHGDARGRTLGFPTANINVGAEVRLPKPGIYVVKIKVADKWYHGVASIGFNVTFGAGRGMTVEVFILDFDQDIYGEQVAVEWLHYLREEIKFSGKEALIQQLNQDVAQTREYFRKESET